MKIIKLINYKYFILRSLAGRISGQTSSPTTDCCGKATRCSSKSIKNCFSRAIQAKWNENKNMTVNRNYCPLPPPQLLITLLCCFYLPKHLNQFIFMYNSIHSNLIDNFSLKLINFPRKNKLFNNFFFGSKAEKVGKRFGRIGKR